MKAELFRESRYFSVEERSSDLKRVLHAHTVYLCKHCPWQIGLNIDSTHSSKEVTVCNSIVDLPLQLSNPLRIRKWESAHKFLNILRRKDDYRAIKIIVAY
jgi:hypothetical protein